MRRSVYILFTWFILFSGFHWNAYAQETEKQVLGDSVLILQPGMDTTLITNNIDSIFLDQELLNRPKTAAFYSAALPGLGQVYNGSFWKLPIIYGSFITMGYFINWNDAKYQQYRNALFDQIKGYGDVTNPLAQVASEDALRRGVEYYRRNRDYLMILTAGLYFLQIVEAHVEAHLMEFDISEDLIATIKPKVSCFYASNYSYGLSLVIHLN